MENKFTPAPWRTEIQRERDGEFTPYFDVRSDDPNMKQVCSCTNFAWLGDDGLVCAEANAKLIAAAPEMFAALEYIQQHVKDTHLHPKIWKMIQSAIRKATLIMLFAFMSISTMAQIPDSILSRSVGFYSGSKIATSLDIPAIGWLQMQPSITIARIKANSDTLEVTSPNVRFIKIDGRVFEIKRDVFLKSQYPHRSRLLKQ